MSETSVKVVAFHRDPEQIKAIAEIFEAGARDDGDGAWFWIDSLTAIDRVVIASIAGGARLDVDALTDKLQAFDPDWLLVNAYYSQVDQYERKFFKKGGRPTTKKTLLKNIRAASPEADLYFALAEGDLDRVEALLKDESVRIDLVLDGAPLLLRLLESGRISLLELAAAREVRLDQTVQRSQWFEFVHAVKGMNLLGLALQIDDVAPAVIEFLIRQGLDVEAVDEEGDTPLMLAANDTSRHRFIEPLVAAGADINRPDAHGYPPIFAVLANLTHDPDAAIALVGKMIALGADIEYVAPDKANALWMVKGGSPRLKDYVRSRGVTVAVVPDGFYDGDMFSKTARAIDADDPESLACFFDPGELKDSQKLALLERTIMAGNKAILEVMLDKGIPASLRGGGRIFPHEMAEHYGEQEIADYLRGEMAEFEAASAEAIAKVRPFYDAFMERFTRIPERGDGDVSSVHGDFSEACWERYKPSLDLWTQWAANSREGKVKAEVDDAGLVNFYRPSRAGQQFQVTIDIKDRPMVVGLRHEVM